MGAFVRCAHHCIRDVLVLLNILGDHSHGEHYALINKPREVACKESNNP